MHQHDIKKSIWIVLYTLLTCSVFGSTIGFAVEENSSSAPVEDSKESSIDWILEGKAPSNVDDLRVMQAHVASLVTKIIPAVVGVQVGSSQGSGVVIDRDGYVLTAGHVIGGADRRATFFFHDEHVSRGRTLGANFLIDSGLMKISGDEKHAYAEFGTSTGLKRGQWVLSVGHPGGFVKGRSPVVRLGRILRVTDSSIQTDCPLVGGDSGGPLFDMKGKVIGINSRIGGELTYNVHVPVNTYGEYWDRLAAGEEIGRRGNREETRDTSGDPYIGIVPKEGATDATIGEVKAGQPAELAGLKVGDVIIEFAGNDIDTFETLVRALKETHPKQTVDVTVRRSGSEKKIELTIGEKSE